MVEERTLTPRRSREIVELLRKRRGWTLTRVAKAINTTTDFVRRVHRAEQNFEERDVVALAKACRLEPCRLLFDSLTFDSADPEQRNLRGFALEVIAQHEAFARAMARKPQKKRRNGRKAA